MTDRMDEPPTVPSSEPFAWRTRGRSAAATFRRREDGGPRARSAFDPPWNLMVNHLAAATVLPPAARVGLYRAAGITCRSIKVAPGLWVYSDRLVIEVGAFIGWNCRIHNEAAVVIAANAFLGPEVMLLTTSHELGSHDQRAGAPTSAPITIGPGAWIGARTTVLPGVTIGAGAIVAAGSVVTTDCAPDTLSAGVPAVAKRDLADPST